MTWIYPLTTSRGEINKNLILVLVVVRKCTSKVRHYYIGFTFLVILWVFSTSEEIYSFFILRLLSWCFFWHRYMVSFWNKENTSSGQWAWVKVKGQGYVKISDTKQWAPLMIKTICLGSIWGGVHEYCGNFIIDHAASQSREMMYLEASVAPPICPTSNGWTAWPEVFVCVSIISGRVRRIE